MKSVHHLTSVFNIPEIEDEELDYRKLYEKEKKLRAYYQRKSRELQGKLRTLAKDNKHTFGRNKLQGIQEILQDIKSFKCMLPNSIKEIPVVDSDASIENLSTPTLLKEWAIYGISEEDLLQVNECEKYEGAAVISNSNPSQILQHTSRLVFPSGTSAKILSGKQASEYSLQIINLSKQKLKSFILSFQPTFTNKKEPEQQNQKDKKQLQIINQLNPERRVYAICIQVQQFTVLEGQNKMIELKTPKKLSSKGQKTVKFKSAIVQNTVQQFKIVVSKRVYCLFSYYPFFSFYEQLLRSLFYAIKVQRYIRYKEGGSNLKAVDSKFHTSLVKDVLQHLKKESTNKAIVLDRLLDFQLCGNNKVYLQLNIDSLTFLVAEEWAYYILSLFTLDVFLDLLTLLMLEQKMVFVCDNPTILTYAIFLFTKVLIRPFQYPYPVVNIIPDQQQYLNAPFPVVYGYLKTKEEIIEAKIPKRYKNVYVIFQPTGIQILSEQCKKKLLSKKSPRLRDRLISKFKKMQRNFPTTNFFSFMQKKNEEFQYPVNKTLAREILSEVHNYIQNDIFRLLPNQVEIGTIKTFLATTKDLDEDDMNQQVFLKIKEDYSQKSKDPFFSAFLDTQLLNVHIFKY